jgi:hypothetical protein
MGLARSGSYLQGNKIPAALQARLGTKNSSDLVHDDPNDHPFLGENRRQIKAMPSLDSIMIADENRDRSSIE